MCRGSGCRSIRKGDSQQSTFSNGGIPSVSHHLSGERAFPLFCYPETAGVQVWLPALDKKLSETPLFNLLPSYPTLCHPPLSLGSLISFSRSKLLISPRWRETGEEVWDLTCCVHISLNPYSMFHPCFLWDFALSKSWGLFRTSANYCSAFNTQAKTSSKPLSQ